MDEHHETARGADRLLTLQIGAGGVGVGGGDDERERVVGVYIPHTPPGPLICSSISPPRGTEGLVRRLQRGRRGERVRIRPSVRGQRGFE